MSGDTLIMRKTLLSIGLACTVVMSSSFQSNAVDQFTPIPNVNYPELPRLIMDPTFSAPTTGTARFVGAGESIQAAINASQPGDIILIQAGTTFHESLSLPKKNNPENKWIYIMSSDWQQLPAPGTRVSPTDAAHMAKVVSLNGKNAVLTEDGANYFRFVGIEFTHEYLSANVFYNIVRLFGDTTNHIIVDRCWIHAPDPKDANTYDGIVVVAVDYWAVVDSYISDIVVSQNQEECHGIQILGGTGSTNVMLVRNNYISAAGENVIFGGNVGGQGYDIVFEGNYLFKPPSWRNSFTSGININQKPKVKNIFELKMGSRVLVQNNWFEGNWTSAQQGRAIVITPREQDIDDVTFRGNIIGGTHSYTEAAFHLGPASNDIHRFLFSDNLIFNVEQRAILLSPTGFVADDVTISHNTAAKVGGAPMEGTAIFIEAGTAPFNRLYVGNNILDMARYGILGSGYGAKDAVAAYTVNSRFQNDVILRDIAYPNPPFENYNQFGSGYSDVKFTSLDLDTVDDFKLLPDSPYKNAGVDGRDLGADIDPLLSVLQCVPTGNCFAKISYPINPPAHTPNSDAPTELQKNIVDLSSDHELVISCENSVSVINRRGDLIRELSCAAGSAVWDVRDKSGRNVSAGTYILRESGKHNRKIVVIK
jgi:hypothetical protein